MILILLPKQYNKVYNYFYYAYEIFIDTQFYRFHFWVKKQKMVVALLENSGDSLGKSYWQIF